MGTEVPINDDEVLLIIGDFQYDYVVLMPVLGYFERTQVCHLGPITLHLCSTSSSECLHSAHPFWRMNFVEITSSYHIITLHAKPFLLN